MKKALIALAVALALAGGIAAVSVVTSLLIESVACSDVNDCDENGREEDISSHHAGTQGKSSRRPAFDLSRKTR